MNNTKTYLPKSSAKEITTKFGTMLKLSFNVDALVEFAQANRNAKGWLNVTVQKRKETGKYGETHSLILDTWEPTGAKQNEPAQPATGGLNPDGSVPF